MNATNQLLTLVRMAGPLDNACNRLPAMATACLPTEGIGWRSNVSGLWQPAANIHKNGTFLFITPTPYVSYYAG